jgi:hypothetical protein
MSFFNWFGRGDKPDNVVEFPTPRVVPPMPYIVPPEPEVEKPARVFYRLGVTDKNRVALSMGVTEITMTKAGVENLIQQLQVFRDQLQDEEQDEE